MAGVWDREGITERLRVLMLEGLSASQLAKALNREYPGAGLTRNATIGKVHRMGWGPIGGGRASAPAKVPRAPRPPRPAPAPRPTYALPPRAQQPRPFGNPGSDFAPEAKPPTPERVEAPRTDLVPLESLGAHMCKWPIGDPQLDGFGFCGRGTCEDSEAEGRFYCWDHRERSRSKVQPAKPAKSKRAMNDQLRALRRHLAA
jgi:GcrA cell cycle regulator